MPPVIAVILFTLPCAAYEDAQTDAGKDSQVTLSSLQTPFSDCFAHMSPVLQLVEVRTALLASQPEVVLEAVTQHDSYGRRVHSAAEQVNASAASSGGGRWFFLSLLLLLLLLLLLPSSTTARRRRTTVSFAILSRTTHRNSRRLNGDDVVG